MGETESYICVDKNKWVKAEKISQEVIIDKQILAEKSDEYKQALKEKRKAIFRHLYKKTDIGFEKIVCDMEQKINALASEADKVYAKILKDSPSKLYKRKKRISN
jgi:hypothetical protein